VNVLAVLKDSFDIVKKNLVLSVPMLALTVITAVLSLIFIGSMIPFAGGMAKGGMSPEGAIGAAGAALGGLFIVVIISAILGLFAHGMTVAMVEEAVSSEKATLKKGWAAARQRLVPLIIAAFLVGIIIGIGALLLVLPGIIAAFLLMFTFVVVMREGENAFGAIGKSFKMVTRHFGAVLVLFLVLIALGLIVGIVDSILALIPILGVILTIILSAVYAAYATTYVVLTYHRLEEKAEEAPEPKV
jgi:MFS family permease